jgi:regulator of replication initiation timing
MAQPIQPRDRIRIPEQSYIGVLENKLAQARQQIDQQEAVILGLIEENERLRMAEEESEDASTDD